MKSYPRMEDLLKEQAELSERLFRREVVWVKVVQALSDQVLVDIGEKREAVIPASEFSPGTTPQAGTRVPAVLLSRGHGETPTKLSMRKAQWQLGWEQAAKAFSDKARVRGRVSSAVKGGYLVDVGGVTGFLPASLADLRPVRKPQALVGTGVRCYILSINKDKQQLVLSRKAVLEEEVLKRKRKALSDLKVGDIRIARVTRVAGFGALADIGGLEGLIATVDVAWKNSEQAKAKLARGQKVRVRVLAVDAQAGKVSFGMKQLTPHPADALRKKYPLKSSVKGQVAEISKDGVRIRLADSTEAFCPVGELPVEGVDLREHGRRGEAEPEPKPVWPKLGDQISAVVTGIRPQTFDLTVSIRRHEAIQDKKRVARYLKGAPPLTLGQLLNPEGE